MGMGSNPNCPSNETEEKKTGGEAKDSREKPPLVVGMFDLKELEDGLGFGRGDVNKIISGGGLKGEVGGLKREDGGWWWLDRSSGSHLIIICRDVFLAI